MTRPSLYRALTLVVMVCVMLAGALPVLALDKDRQDRAIAAAQKAVEYLKTKQGADGSWSPQPGPAITALVVRGLLMSPGFNAKDQSISLGVAYILSKARPDGGIHGGILENYNTAISLSALALVRDHPGVPEKIKAAQDYLRNLQWAGQADPAGKPIDESHPFYGGAGYGREGRPDMSNTQIMLEGLADSGMDCKDPAFQRAMVFISRCQGSSTNKMYGARIANDGGFIYATSQGKDKIGTLESKAGEVKMEDGTTRLATYGSMTYAGFKSYLYAQLPRDDSRVVEAFGWIQHNYTLDENPGLPRAENKNMQGYYYYLLTFSRALDAWGQQTIKLSNGSERDWAADLIDKLTATQNPDGSWTNKADRWMEGDPTLTTAYALIAIEHALR
ncbi:MAG: terpene cyclase/mutase family protein [Planctomycetes bacterium]|nr:terpene cyclase/mutase family protein [Planctomycetota bacterium]